jgi:hypothetical protein
MSAPKREGPNRQDESFDLELTSAPRVMLKTSSREDDRYVSLRERVISRFPKTLARLAK